MKFKSLKSLACRSSYVLELLISRIFTSISSILCGLTVGSSRLVSESICFCMPWLFSSAKKYAFIS